MDSASAVSTPGRITDPLELERLLQFTQAPTGGPQSPTRPRAPAGTSGGPERQRQSVAACADRRRSGYSMACVHPACRDSSLQRWGSRSRTTPGLRPRLQLGPRPGTLSGRAPPSPQGGTLQPGKPPWPGLVKDLDASSLGLKRSWVSALSAT